MFKPTDEQAAAISEFAKGGDIKIVAGAGTGKTSTLKLISESTDRRGVYIAFNRAMAEDAKRRMPANVAVSTAHSLAFRRVHKGFRDKIGPRLPAALAAQAGGIDADTIDLTVKNGKNVHLTQAAVGYFLIDWVRRHCMSADVEIGESSAPIGSALEFLGVPRDEVSPEDWAAAREVVASLFDAAKKLWGRMSNPHDNFPATHDVYLKVWATTNPKIGADFILFDEAQDANALMLDIVNRQAAQKVYVGDPNQQIYAWRGAVNAMQSIKTDSVAHLTESFRFGPEIAEFANLALELCGSDLRLTGKAIADRNFAAGGKPLKATICRTNAGVINALLDVPDISNTYIAGGVSQIIGLLNGMLDLRTKGHTNNIELCRFGGWIEFVEHVTKNRDDLSALFKLTNNGQNIEAVISLIEKTAPSPRPGSYVISTAHKCKGLEWADVELSADFCMPNNPNRSGEDANLLYVAGTRAMRSLSLASSLAGEIKSKTFYGETFTAKEGSENAIAA